MTDAELAELRTLIQNMGYLPHSNKAFRLLAEWERLHPGDATVSELQQRFQESGYLPRSRALQLLDDVAQLRTAPSTSR